MSWLEELLAGYAPRVPVWVVILSHLLAFFSGVGAYASADWVRRKAGHGDTS